MGRRVGVEEGEKLGEDETKITKRLTFLISPLKRINWNDGKRSRGKRPKKI